MKILLVYPPIEFGKKRGFGFPPLGLLYIASYLKEKGIEVKVIDAFIEGYDLPELTYNILKEFPDFVCFSSMTCQIKNVIAVSKELKRNASALKIIVGGPHISSTLAQMFSFSEHINFLVYGEGEETIHKLISGASLEKIDGIIYKKEDRIIVNKPSSPIENLDELPFPNLDMVDIGKYDSYYAKSLPLTSLMASRGCCFNCNFCDSYATHGKIIRFRTPENIVDEIERNYKKYNIKQVMIKDSTFTVNKKWVKDICLEIKKRDLDINWTCNTRADMVDMELLDIMKRSGCYMILFGLESGVQEILDKMHKGITVQDIKNAISLCKKAGIQTAGYFMVGNLGETEDDALRTVEFSKELNLDMATFGVTVAYPGTELYQHAIQNNAIDPLWYMKDAISSKSVREMDGNLNLNGFSKERQIEIATKANKEFYLRPSYILKKILRVRNFQDINRGIKAVGEL